MYQYIKEEFNCIAHENGDITFQLVQASRDGNRLMLAGVVKNINGIDELTVQNVGKLKNLDFQAAIGFVYDQIRRLKNKRGSQQ